MCTIDCSLRPWKNGSSVAELVERLPDAVHVAVAEDPEHGGHEPPALAVAYARLHLQVADERLGGGQPDRRRRPPGNDNRQPWD